MSGLGRVSQLWQRLMQPLNRSVRNRFVALALFPLVVGFPVLLLLLAGWGGAAFQELLVFKVRSDLAVATTYFERVQGELSRSIEALATSEMLADAQRRPGQAMDGMLQARAEVLGLDYLLLLDEQRHVLASSSPAARAQQY